MVQAYGRKLKGYSVSTMNEKLKELYHRRTICRFSIHVLDTQAAGDPRQPEAMEHYKQQLAEIDAQIAKIEGKKVDPLAKDFPGVQDGLRGMQFIEAVVKSSAMGAKWVKM